jgi:beta-glucosidase
MNKRKYMWRHLAGLMAVATIAGAAQPPATPPAPVNPALWPQPTSPFKSDAALEKRVADLMAKMTLEEKVGQVIQPDINSVTPDDMRRYHFGSILAGGNSSPDKDEFAPPARWLALADAFYNASVDRSNGGQGIPSIWGIDAMHGHSNVVTATLFPHNIGLGAMRNPELIEAIGKVTATEIRATGIEWTFAPTLTVPQDTRWGRAYEGYSEDPAVVISYAAAMVRGLQGKPGDANFLKPPHVMATAKHFLGDGGTENGRDQGNTRVDEATLAKVHGAPYAPAIEAGLMSVMASYNSWNGVKMHGHKGALNDVLKVRMGFQGFIVGDWNGHGQVPGCRATSCAASLMAGLDMFMAPDSWRGLYDNTLAQAKSGELPMQRLDDAVARILRVKFRMGLFEAGPPSKRPGAGNFATLGAPSHRELARRAVRESVVLLKNNGGVLPLKPKQKVLVTGDGADSLSKQSGGWTLTWQGTGADNSKFPGATSIWAGIRDNVQKAGGTAELSGDGSYKAKPDVAIVVFGENPYAEGVGDRRNLLLRADGSNHLEILAKLKAEKIPVVAVFLSGRPLWVNRELNASQAFIAAFLPGSEGAGIADLLFQKSNGGVAHDFRGKLSFSWPKTATQYALHRDQPGYDPLFAFGFGLTYKEKREQPALSEDSGVTGADAPGGTVFSGAEASAWKMAASGGVTLTRFDRQRQEDSMKLVWSGTAAGTLGFDSTAGEDFSRETNADMFLVLTVKVDGAPEAATSLTANCGAGCRGSVALQADLAAMPKGQWQRLGVPLKCFTRAGADMNARLTRFELATGGKMDLSVNRIALGTEVDRTSTCALP